MSEWYHVESLNKFGETFMPSGMGKTYVQSISSYTQTVSLLDTREARFWFPGNGVDSYLVMSAKITQGALSTSLRVSGKTSFYVPREGRWSDWASITNFALPGSVIFTFSVGNTSDKIPTTTKEPSTPVGVSAYERKTITEDLPETELEEEVGDLIDSLPFVENFQNFDNWAVWDDFIGITPTISEGLYINLPKLEEEYHGNGSNIWINHLISHLPDKFSLEVITNCDSVPISSRCNIIIYLYTLDFTFVGLVLAITPDAPFEILYKPLENKIQKWRWEIDTTNTGRPIERIYYDDELITEIAGAGYFISATSGIAGLQIEVSNHYDTGADLRLHIKSITITDGISDISLTEVTSTCTITVTENPAPGDTLTINNSATTVFTFVDHYPNNSGEIQIGTTTAITASNIATAISNITGAEFAATTVNNIITIVAHVSTPFSVTTTSAGLTIGTITETIPGYNAEEATVTDVFTATDGGKATQENATVTDSTDGLIDGLAENSSVATSMDCLIGDMDEGVGVTTTSDNFDGLIEYMGEEIT
jgi:hypothetical protein